MTKTKNMIGAGLGLAAISALVAYFLHGEKGLKNRRLIAGWVLKIKSEVLEKIEEIKDLKEKEYYRIVDEAAARYAKLEKVGAAELKHLAKELKGSWKHLGKQPEAAGNHADHRVKTKRAV